MSATPSADIPQFEISSERGPGDTFVVRVVGEVDMSHEDDVRAELRRAVNEKPSGIVVDLTECEFIDSSVLALFVDLRKRLNSTSRSRFAIVADGQPLQVIETTQLDREIPVFSSADDAVRAVSG